MSPFISVYHQRYLYVAAALALWGMYYCSFSASSTSLTLALISSGYWFVATAYWVVRSLKRGTIILEVSNTWLGALKKAAAIFALSLGVFSLNFLGVYLGLASAYTQLVADKHEVLAIIEGKHPAGGMYSTYEIDLSIAGKVYSNVRVPVSFYKSVRVGNILSLPIKESSLGTEFYF